MSTHYRLTLEVSGYRRDQEAAIRRAAEKEWPFEPLEWGRTEHNWNYAPTNPKHQWITLEQTADGDLHDAEEFVKDLTHIIWRANEAPCEVRVFVTCMEDLPTDEYFKDEEDYADWAREEGITQTVEPNGDTP